MNECPQPQGAVLGVNEGGTVEGPMFGRVFAFHPRRCQGSLALQEFYQEDPGLEKKQTLHYQGAWYIFSLLLFP